MLKRMPKRKPPRERDLLCVIIKLYHPFPSTHTGSGPRLPGQVWERIRRDDGQRKYREGLEGCESEESEESMSVKTKGFSRERTAAFTTIRQREHAHRHAFDER